VLRLAGIKEVKRCGFPREVALNQTVTCSSCYVVCTVAWPDL